MILLIAQYFLAGTIIALFLEILVRWADQDVSHWERILMITVWPVMVLIFVWNFIVGLFGRN